MFSREFSKIFKNIFFIEHLWTTVSVPQPVSFSYITQKAIIIGLGVDYVVPNLIMWSCPKYYRSLGT